MRSWEADEQVAELLDLAVRTTGASLREIVNEAIREHAPGIILRLLEERGVAEAKLRSLLRDKYGKPEADTPEGARMFMAEPRVPEERRARSPKR
jgi:hypothetical protein